MSFEVIGTLNGSTPRQTPRYVASATAIEYEFVKLTPGTGIVAVDGTDFDDPALGVPTEKHDGATTGRQTGTEIEVSDSPDAIYKNVPGKYITATGGSTTTFVDSSILPATNDIFNGGYLKIRTCAADSSLVGKKILITDFTGAGGTFTFGAQVSAFASGDTAYLCPGKLAEGSYGWDLNSDGTEVDFESSGAEALSLWRAIPENFECHWVLRLHQFGNDAAAK